MGNKICRQNTWDKPGPIGDNVEVSIKKDDVAIQDSNDPAPELPASVRETLNREKFFQDEVYSEKSTGVKYQDDYYIGSLDENGNRPNGFGRMYKQNGGVYLGWFDHGHAHGKGAFVFPNGAFYKGQFHENKANTEMGKYQSDEMTYDGGFRDNKFHGKAYERGNGYTYEGTYANGIKQHGKLKWSAQNGQYVYDGPFNEQNQFHGKGILQEPIGRYEGSFVNGEKEGQFGIYISDNRTRYEGSYVNGYREGYGTIYNMDGTVAYKGEMKRGLPHGTGSIFKDGKEMKTTWVEGIDSNLLPESQL